MKKVRVLAIMAFMMFAAVAPAQVSHGRWSGNFNVGGNSLLTPRIPDMVYGAVKGYNDELKELSNYFSPYYRWISPTRDYDFHIPNWRMDGAELKGPYWWRCLLFGDFSHDYNFALGYTLKWRSFDLPVGFRIGVNYEWRGLCVADGPLAGMHCTSGLVPSVGVNWRVLGLDFEREHGWNLLLDGGASYAKMLTYNNPCGLGREVANSGCRWALSLGVVYSNWQYSLRYEWDCYDYLNVAGYGTHIQNLVLSAGVAL